MWFLEPSWINDCLGPFGLGLHKRCRAMLHASLFLAAATVLFGSVTALWAEPLPVSNSTEISSRDLGPSPVTVPAELHGGARSCASVIRC